MARSDVTELYQKLTNTEFDFVPRGERALQSVYLFVQNQYSSLCDDGFLCIKNCRSGNNSPEWQHVVRKALEELKRRQSTAVVPGSEHGYWTFVGAQFSPIASDLKEPPAQRVAVTTYRAVRDTALTRRIKALHRNKCQICGEAIPLPQDQTYSEAHHIQPLGEPHNGPDIAENILILCPNHHVMCDYGSIRLDTSMLRKHPDHAVGEKFIRYHNTKIATVLSANE